MTVFPIQTSDQKAVLAVAISFTVLPILAVSLRLLAHRIAHKRWTLGDYLLIGACFFGVGLQAVSIAGIVYGGIGYGHTKDVIRKYGRAPVELLYKFVLPMEFCWALSLDLTKMSILNIYLKVFPIPWVTYWSYAVMGIVTAWTTSFALLCILICRPFKFHWDKTVPGGKCDDQVLAYMIVGVANVLTDIVVLVLPIYPLSQLRMAMYKKVILITVFGLGSITCVVSVYRVYVLSTMDFADLTYTIPKADIFSCIEPCLAVVLASVPLMRPLLDVIPRGSHKRWFGRREHVDYHIISQARSNHVGTDWLSGIRKHVLPRPMGRQDRIDNSDLESTLAKGSTHEEDELPERREGHGRINI